MKNLTTQTGDREGKSNNSEKDPNNPQRHKAPSKKRMRAMRG